MAMSSLLRGRFIKSVGAGALAIAFTLLSGHGGLEGREYKAYRDVVGVLTVCDGHTGPDIILGKVYTDAECDALTKSDLQKIANTLRPYIKVPVTETQLAAIYTFAYNVGVYAVIKSTLLKLLNQGDYQGACDQLKRWIYAGGKPWKGLMNRRAVEYEVCTWRPT